MFLMIKRNKKYLIFISIILLIGFCSGIIYYILLNTSVKESISLSIINYSNFRYNSIIKDLIITSLLIVTSFIIIGIPLSLFYLFYEGLSLGLIFTIFITNFKLSGFIYFLLYFLINKLIILFLMFFFIKRIISISRYIIGLIIYRRDISIKNKIICNVKNSLYLIVIILFINIILYFITPPIFNYFSFLLK